MLPNYTQTEIDNLADGQEEIQNYFSSDVDADDIPSLWNLKQKFSLLNAFTTVFRGDPTGVMVRLHVLADMCDRPVGTTSWNLSELRHHFAYITDTAFDTVMRRLRGGDLINYDRENNSYSVTSLGLQVNSAVTYFLKSYEDEGLGLITGILYAGEAMGNISKEELAHLLNRLGQLEQELHSAIESASEPAILKARERFDSIWKRLEQGTDIISRIAKNQDMDRDTHRLGQSIAQAQSRLARVTSVFQRAINDLDRRRIHLGNSGVSTSDLNKLLINKTPDELIELLNGVIGMPVQPVFVLTDLLCDVAEDELKKDRERLEEFRLPSPVHSLAEDNPNDEDIPHLRELTNDLANLKEDMLLLKTVIPKENFEVSSYRLSMLSLADGSPDILTDGPLAELLNLPLTLHVEDGSEEVMKHGVYTISKGTIRRESL